MEMFQEVDRGEALYVEGVAVIVVDIEDIVLNGVARYFNRTCEAGIVACAVVISASVSIGEYSAVSVAYVERIDRRY